MPNNSTGLSNYLGWTNKGKGLSRNIPDCLLDFGGTLRGYVQTMGYKKRNCQLA